MGFDIAAYVEAASEAVGMPLDTEARARVVAQFEVTAAMAAQIMDFPLPPEAEAAPVFKP